ncbi:MAG: nuclear transport factor 2 family protein [Candidatus Azotimanducaceae bacterium]
MSTNEQVVRNFIEAWSRLDPAELAGFFHESGVYHNVPAKPVEGRESVQSVHLWLYQHLDRNRLGDFVLVRGGRLGDV